MTYLLEHQGHQTFFTSLLTYQVKGTEAPVMLTLTYYTDLIETKGIVLLRGEIEEKGTDLESAKQLVETMRNFYLGDEYSLVQQMHHSPSEFKFENVIELAKAYAANADSAKENAV
jgi:ATP synthase F1 complex assembly factor 1